MTPATILDLASRFDGYMVPFNAEVLELLESGQITIRYACEGFVIARAIPKPAGHRRAPYGWHGPRGSFVRQYLSERQLSDCQRPEGER